MSKNPLRFPYSLSHMGEASSYLKRVMKPFAKLVDETDDWLYYDRGKAIHHYSYFTLSNRNGLDNERAWTQHLGWETLLGEEQ